MLVATFLDNDNNVIDIVQTNAAKTYHIVGMRSDNSTYDGFMYVAMPSTKTAQQVLFDGTRHQLSYIDASVDPSYSRNGTFVKNDPIHVHLGTVQNGDKFGIRYEDVLRRITRDECTRLYDEFSNQKKQQRSKSKDMFKSFVISTGQSFSGRFAEKVAKAWLHKSGATVMKAGKSFRYKSAKKNLITSLNKCIDQVSAETGVDFFSVMKTMSKMEIDELATEYTTQWG